MSWELASFLILGGVLLAGFAWYERSRPPSQVVALVAALAALAIAGRIAFAAFPNVKPTTDIVIVAGYALGPAPGFAVGALTALVSNLWFGQGPWTPWQMAGWGLCGIYGAVLALLWRRGIGRLTLAAACGLAGVAYGALLNFSLMATYGGELSVQRFAALESRAIPFDLAHAIGNIVFALIAGPAMLRMLARFRERFEWRARTPALAGTVLAALLLVSAIPSQANGATGATGAADWLVSVQNSDGGWGSSPGSSSSASITSWSMLGLEAAGRNPLDISKGGSTPVDYLRSTIGDIESSGDYARTILALEGAGVDAHSFGGTRPGQPAGQSPRQQRLLGRVAGDHRVRGARAARRRRHRRSRKVALVAGRRPEQRRRLGRRTEQAEHPRQHRRRDAGAAELEALPARPLVPQIGAALERRIRPHRQRPGELAVDGVGGAGDDRDRHRSGIDLQRRQLGAGLPARAPGLRRPLQLLLLEQPDPGLGHGPGPAGDRRQLVPDLAGAAPGAEAEAGAEQTRRKLSGAADPDDSRSADPALEQRRLGLGIGSGSGSGGSAPLTPPAATPGPPIPVSPTTGEGAAPETPPLSKFEATEPPHGPHPLAPIGVGVGTGALALGGVMFLGRRFSW